MTFRHIGRHGGEKITQNSTQVESLRELLSTKTTFDSWGRAFAACLVAVALLCTFQSSAQTATGSIVGTVTDQAGAVVPKATVTLTNIDTNQVRTTVTDAGGYFALTLLPPANYKLGVEASGFRQYLQSGIKLDVGNALTMNVACKWARCPRKLP